MTSSASKSKKVKVLMRRPRRIETAEVPKIIEGSTSMSEPSHSVPVEARTNVTEEPKMEKTAEKLKVLSPPYATALSKVSNIPVATPRKNRTTSVLDAVMESVKTSTPTSAEAPRTETKVSKKSDEAGMAQTISKVVPSVSAEAKPSEIAPLILEKEDAPEKSKSPAPGAPAEELEFIVRHASGSNYRRSRLPKQNNMPRI
jgi:hypothetical protein